MSIRARREVAGFKERGDPSEGAWNGNGISSHFERETDFGGQAISLSKSVSAAVIGAGIRRYLILLPSAQKCHHRGASLEGHPPRPRPSRPPLVPIFGKDRGGRIRHLTRSVGRIELHVFPIFFTFYGDGFPAGRPSASIRRPSVLPLNVIYLISWEGNRGETSGAAACLLPPPSMFQRPVLCMSVGRSVVPGGRELRM